MVDDERRIAPLTMDRSEPVGNTEDTFGRRAHHVKIGNKPTEPVPVSGTFTSGSSATPTISNTVTVLANTEYSYAFPVDTKRFIIKARGNAKLQVAYATGQTNTTFLTIPPGATYSETELKLPSNTIYFESNKAGETVEITSWV